MYVLVKMITVCTAQCNNCTGWVQGLAVQGGYRDWLYRVDTGTGCTGWIQGLVVQGGYRDLLYRMDIGTGCTVSTAQCNSGTGWIQGLAAGLLVPGWKGNGGPA